MGMVGTPANALDARALGARWEAERFTRIPAPCLTPGDLGIELDRFRRSHPQAKVEEVGRSVQGRPIFRITVGRGAREVLLWSQMHGDEPSATPALLDLAHYVLQRSREPEIARLLDELTLRIVPMLNPDGAEIYGRRNAQGIDLNRDARNLATPEGRLLKQLRDQHDPVLGFNLHDQNRRRTVGTSGVLATISVLAVVGDEAKTVTAGRKLSMRASVAIADTLQAFVPGGVGRFDDTFSPRSFGDNLTAWGTPVVLIESGGVPGGGSLEELTRLNFVALFSALAELAQDGLARRDLADYEAIPENNVDLWADIALRGGRVLQPGLVEPFRADVVFDRPVRDRERAGCDEPGAPRSEIVEIGDARVFGAGQELDGQGMVALPSFTIGAEGLASRRWLDELALARLADLGVARVVWAVDERDVGTALLRAGELAGPRVPRIEVVGDPAKLPPVVLTRAPESARSLELGAAVERIERAAGSRTPEEKTFAARLARLWADGSAAIRFEGPATFQVAKSNGGVEELVVAPVRLILIDGLDVFQLER
jgi:hypothetical protein